MAEELKEKGKLKSTDIFGIISIINKIDVMKDIKELARENTKIANEKNMILDRISMLHFKEIEKLENDLTKKEDPEINKKLTEFIMKLLQEKHPEEFEKIGKLNADIASWKFDFISIILSNIGKAEKDIYSWLSRYSGEDQNIFKDDPVAVTECILEVMKDPNLSRLYDLMKKSKMI